MSGHSALARPGCLVQAVCAAELRRTTPATVERRVTGAAPMAAEGEAIASAPAGPRARSRGAPRARAAVGLALRLALLQVFRI